MGHVYFKQLILMAMAVAYFWGIFIVMFPLVRYSLWLLLFLSLIVSALIKREPEKKY
jgi:hypothetical protein